ncbi:hypothetical protein POSPLADRAFT_1133002 [Postia placenta MAD-698-R-SB12]|uniref:Rpr2-domain-containing protein n=1 Tax=Postia placenta MAD-698-R-SB12 TaxID=670580 RepID=A0A1X6NCB0_9APHY|nr:hypothetical protein POSPLADRAFT_1133002 [Postia placenta MAD-698-R-SB12]OSX66023.1 hypothetical protein POSPLADRAFT_1133002 [Postia placenta MAD-698-R-SB12]
MAKKNKGQDSTVTINGVANRDILQRLNFLYQASTYLNSIAPHPTDEPITNYMGEPLTCKERKTEMRRQQRHPATTSDLSRSYVKSMKIIGQKATVRMDPSVKRTICKKCNTVMVSGTTADVRIRTSPVHGHVVCYICKSCSTSRRIPAPPVLDPDAQLDIQPSTPTLPAPIVPGPEEEQSTGDAMQVDTPAPTVPAAGLKGVIRKPRTKEKKRPKPRLLPLFQRKGHVVFRGNERLEDDTAT